MSVEKINQELGNADLFLIDQILKGRFNKSMKILDAGCGEGRNLTWFITNGFDVSGIDADESSIRMLKFAARNLNPDFDTSSFSVQSIEHNTLKRNSFDVILCYSVLHFSENREHFFKLINSLAQLIKPGGRLLIGMESDFGLMISSESKHQEKTMNPKGDLRFLLNERLLEEILRDYPLRLAEPVRYDVIKEHRSWAYLVLNKTTA